MATTQRSVRVDDETWEQFKAACVTLGSTPSSQLQSHIRNTIANAAMINGVDPTSNREQKST